MLGVIFVKIYLPSVNNLTFTDSTTKHGNRNCNGMKKRISMKKLLFALVTLLTFSCSEKPKSGFSMNGTTTGIENGTVLYLVSELDGRIIDSTIVESNSFKFQTKLSETPFEVI